MGGRTEASIRAALDACVERGAPGVSLAVDAPGIGFSFSGASGRFARESARPLRPEDPFRIASVSKAVTAATAVRLAARGRWELDDPVAPLLPARVTRALRKLEGLDGLEALTVRRLLAHRSGVPDYFFDERFRARARSEPDRIWQPFELVEAAAAVGKLDFPVGSDFRYGDTGYVLVGIAIERITDRPLADAYRSLVFEPLGMEATRLEWHEPRIGREVSHHYDGERDLLPTNTSFDWGGGGLVSTAADLARFMGALFGGELFDERWLVEMTRWGPAVRWTPGGSASYLRYGLGIGANRAAGEEILGATGVWGAFAYFWPAGGASIAGTVNERGADRTGLLDAVVSALRRARGVAPTARRVRDAE